MTKNYFFFLFLLRVLFINGQTTFTSSITPDLSAYGESVNYPGQGEYQIFLDTNDGILDKPIILVDGFDPGDGRTITGIYDLLGYSTTSGTQNLGDYVRSQGFDVVILNFPVYTRTADNTEIDGGADFIERNAMLLVDVINTINSNKVGSEQNVIIGPSMGGLISRYALNYMENHAMNHDTRLWLSFDAPHHGANVPIGLQHQFNFLAFGLGNNSVTAIQPIVNSMLKSPAARQMLIDHFESHLASGSNVSFDPSKLSPEAHPWKAIFDSKINALTSTGFPENTRNIAITNGSGIGAPYKDKLDNDITPGFNVINDTFDVAIFTTAQLAVNFTPATSSNSQLISKIKVVLTFIGSTTLYNENAYAQATSFSDGVDAASGGLFDMGSLTEDLDLSGITGDFVAALKTNFFNFIPTVSSIALEVPTNEIDWYHTIDLGTPIDNSSATDSSPFVNWYMPDTNQPHVTLTEENVAFALSEIMPTPLALQPLLANTIKIEKNPISNELTILSNKIFDNALVSIVDITGKVVYTSNTQIQNRTSIPLQMASGLYVLNIETASKGNFKTKIVVK
ncbi:MAG: T9SS type A sorting domain-containing protein [Gelidibacter sp.]